MEIVVIIFFAAVFLGMAFVVLAGLLLRKIRRRRKRSVSKVETIS